MPAAGVRGPAVRERIFARVSQILTPSGRHAFCSVKAVELEAGPTPFERILAPVDGTSASEIAVRRSEALLRLPGCRLTLLCVGGNDASRRRVENLASEVRGWGAEAVVRAQEGQPAALILKEIESRKHDLVLMTNRRRSPVAGAFPGDVAPAVLRKSRVPLLLYRPLAGLKESFFAVERSEPAKFKRLIVMLDGSIQAEAVIDFSRRIARAFQSELIFFQAISPAEFTDNRMESVRTYLAERAEQASRLGISVRVQISVGDPAEQALGMLDGEADGIALTTRGRSYWATTLLGSVTRRILSVAEGPVLCVSSPAIRTGGRRAIPLRRLGNATSTTVS